jgi:dienelactone hydrolase
MVHEGEPVGEIKDVGGIKSYVSHTKDKKSDNAILFIPDAFGLESINNKLLADDFARAGYLTVIPDIFRGNPIPDKLLKEGMASFDIMAWVGTHPPEVVDPILEATIKGLKGEFGVKNIGAVGYCFGGRYVVKYLVKGKGIDAGFIAHPSLTSNEEIEKIQGPLSVGAAEVDNQLTATKRHEWEEILIKIKVPYQIVLYGDSEHGFAVRADLKDRKKKFAKESAYFQAVRWFDEFVKI